MNSGSPVPARMSRASGTASHPTVGAWTSTSVPPGSGRLTAADGTSSTVPKTPTPTPSTRSCGTCAADTASRSPAAMWSATARGSGRDEPVGDQLGRDVADRTPAEPGEPAELQPAQRPVQEQPREHARAVGTPQVPYGRPLLHGLPSPAAPLLRPPPCAECRWSLFPE